MASRPKVSLDEERTKKIKFKDKQGKKLFVISVAHSKHTLSLPRIVQSIQRLKSANPKLIHIKLEFVLKCS